MFKFLCLFIATIVIAADKEHWDYANNGTKRWGETAEQCDKGKAQSPINIISGKTTEISKDVELEFHPKLAFGVNIIDNGHSIKVTPRVQPHITIKTKKYYLLQFHYHGKSEHSVDGHYYDLVGHSVYENRESKALVVVAVFYIEGPKNMLLEKVLQNVGKHAVISKNLLPKDLQEYYHYVGSLTTPPCNENVNWYLLKTPITASKEQIADMRHYYVNNFRPIQELNNRVIDEH